MKSNNGDLPAMPQSATKDGYACNYGNETDNQVPTGLTKREMFAMHADVSEVKFNDTKQVFEFLNIESDGSVEQFIKAGAQLRAKLQVIYADALLAELEK